MTVETWAPGKVRPEPPRHGARTVLERREKDGKLQLATIFYKDGELYETAELLEEPIKAEQLAAVLAVMNGSMERVK